MQIYKISRLTWFVFVKNANLVTLKIPYNCEFIVIQRRNRYYKLTEFYSFKNKQFRYDFGVYEGDYGLNVTDVSFYWRRLNLNGSRLIAGDYEENEEVSEQIVLFFPGD